MLFGNIITSSANEGSSGGFEKVTLDDNLLIFGAITIQIQNISRLTSYIMKRTCKYRLFMIFLNIHSLPLPFIGLHEMNDSGFVSLGIGLHIHIGYIMTVSFILLLLLLDALFYKRYGVQIQTDGGTIDQLVTKDKDTSRELWVRLIILIKNYNRHEVSEPVTLYKNCEIKIGDHILGDKFSNIENSFIKNHSENVKINE